MQRINLQPGYVLHQRPYRDSSVIIDVLTPEFGRMSLLGKGVKRAKSRFQGQLRAFQPMLVSWCGRGELMTLTQVEIPGKHLQMDGSCLSSGFYLNELLMRLAHKFEPQVEIFNDYDTAVRGLSALSGSSGRNQQLLQAILRIFEIKLLRNLGYEVLLDTEAETNTAVQAEVEYQYHLDHGPVRINNSADNINDHTAKDECELILMRF